MLRSVLFLALALCLGLGTAQEAALLPCASGCVNGVFANVASLGCAAGDMLCMCGKSTDVNNGIRDCTTQTCGADAAAQQPLAEAAGSDRCVAASSSAGLLPTPAPTPTPTPDTGSTTADQAPAETTAPTTAVAETTADPSPSPDPASTTQDSASPSVNEASSSSETSTAQSSSTESASSSPSANTASQSGTSSAAAAASTSDASNTESTESASGLSVAAKAGIGAGVGVAAVMALVVAVCLCMRRKQREKDALRDRAIKISQPLPGSGRQYASGMRQADAGLSRTFTHKPILVHQAQQSPMSAQYSPSQDSVYSNELDVHARRYEDMVSRVQPRFLDVRIGLGNTESDVPIVNEIQRGFNVQEVPRNIGLPVGPELNMDFTDGPIIPHDTTLKLAQAAGFLPQVNQGLFKCCCGSTPLTKTLSDRSYTYPALTKVAVFTA
ncbi:hypothetical protein F4778DRAFT_788500 [Xylariomycetidae sp. FL2044]|nr:hypothetical protein F4778DRAFT_788500 [Xylariomycetidae sp. FL2044]